MRNIRENRVLVSEGAAFLESLAARKQSPATIKLRQTALNRFDRFLVEAGLHRLQDITADDIGRFRLWLEDADFSRHSIENYLSAIKRFFAFLESTGLLFANPTAHLSVRTQPPVVPKILTEPQVRTLLNTPDTSTAVGQRDRALLELLYAAGLRAGEVAALAVHDLDLDRQTVCVTGKGDKQRAVPFGKHATVALTAYLRHGRRQLLGETVTDALWLDQTRKPLKPHMLSVILRGYARQTGIDQLTVHTLRRTCATHLLANGAQPLAVAGILGHASLHTLTHYLAISLKDIRAMHTQAPPGQ